MALYRKKPVVIEAKMYDGAFDSAQEISDWANVDIGLDDPVIDFLVAPSEEIADLLVHTLEGNMLVSSGDYVIKGVQGEFYPCKPDIFEATYEEVT